MSARYSILVQGCKNLSLILGSVLCQDGGIGVDIRNRLNKARNAFMSLIRSMWRSANYSTKTKLRIYQSCVLSTLPYAPINVKPLGGSPGIGGGFDSSHRPVLGTFDRFNGLSSDILLTFSCYFDNPPMPWGGAFEQKLSA